MQKLKNSWLFARAAYGSKAKIHYGDVYNLPDLGRFDIALMAAVLLHTRDPARIIEQCASRADTLIVCEMLCQELEGSPICRLVPSRENGIWDTWWRFSTDFFVQYFGVLGFAERHRVVHRLGPLEFYTLVADRII
jgi:O-methyltransferase